MAKDHTLLNDINMALRAKVIEIWDQIDKTNPWFVAHFASNYTEGLTNDEQQRLQNSLKVYNNFSCEFHTQQSVANKLAHRGRIEVNGKLKAIHKNLFEKSAGDIRSIDIVQIKLEKEFQALNLFYERKNKQHAEQPKQSRVDAERCGQASLAYYFKMPLEAKNKKALIFGDKYDDIFSEETTAEYLLLPLRLLEQVESQRAGAARGQTAWLRYASFHILFALRVLAEKKGMESRYSNFAAIAKLYHKARSAVRTARAEVNKQQRKDFEDVLFFKSSLAKTQIERVLSGNAKLHQ